MSIPTKGSRKITVNGQVFLWLIRRKATYFQEGYPGGCLYVSVQDIEKKGSVLNIITYRLHPKGFIIIDLYCEGKKNPITPANINLWIEEAIKLGWQSHKPGKPFQVKTEKSSLQIVV